MTLDPTFWRGRRVFLTGHTGFKGSWLTLWLHRLGAEVTGFALAPSTSPSLFEAAGLKALCHDHRIGDVRDASALADALLRADPEVVLHLAAQPLVRLSYTDPISTYATNVMGTVHLLEACKRAPSLGSVVVVTSDKCYENKEWIWGYREDEPMGGHDPYSSSKGCAELVVQSWRRSFFPPEATFCLSSARAGNVLGGGDWSPDRLIPDAIVSWHQGRTLTMRSPQAVRPWQHVVDPLRGYLMLAQAGWSDPTQMARGWNFGPRDQDVRPVGEVVKSLATCWGEGARWEVKGQSDHPHEAGLLRLDSSLAASTLGWHPQLDLDACLDATASWYRLFYSGAGATALQDAMGQLMGRGTEAR